MVLHLEKQLWLWVKIGQEGGPPGGRTDQVVPGVDTLE